MATFLTVREAAEQLAISPRHLRRLIARREIRAVRLGRAIRLPEAELRRLAGDDQPGSSGQHPSHQRAGMRESD